MTPDEKLRVWKMLCGLAVEICGGQKQFKLEANILRRLVKQYGPGEVDKMLRGAKALGWNTLRSLGSARGEGRRWAITAFWKAENSMDRRKAPESLRDIFRRLSQ